VQLGANGTVVHPVCHGSNCMTATSCPPLAPQFRLCRRRFMPQCLNARSKHMYQQLV
jgi:hypothetical protein